MDDIAVPNAEYERELQLQNIKDALFFLNHPEERPTAKPPTLIKSDSKNESTPDSESVDSEDEKFLHPRVSAVISHRGDVQSVSPPPSETSSTTSDPEENFSNYTQELSELTKNSNPEKSHPVVDSDDSSSLSKHGKHHHHQHHHRDPNHPHKHFSGLHHERNLRMERKRLRELEKLREKDPRTTKTENASNSSAFYQSPYDKQFLELKEVTDEVDPDIEEQTRILNRQIELFNEELLNSASMFSALQADDPSISQGVFSLPIEDYSPGKPRLLVKREQRLPPPYDKTYAGRNPNKPYDPYAANTNVKAPVHDGFLSQVDRSHDNLETTDETKKDSSSVSTELPWMDSDIDDEKIIIDKSLPEHVMEIDPDGITHESELMENRKNNLKKARAERRQQRKMLRESQRKHKIAKKLNKGPLESRYYPSRFFYDEKTDTYKYFEDYNKRRGTFHYSDIFDTYISEDNPYNGHTYSNDRGDTLYDNATDSFLPRSTGLDQGLIPFYSSRNVRGKLPDSFYEKEHFETYQQRGYFTATEDDEHDEDELPSLINREYSPAIMYQQKLGDKVRNKVHDPRKHRYPWDNSRKNKNSRKRGRDRDKNRRKNRNRSNRKNKNNSRRYNRHRNRDRSNAGHKIETHGGQNYNVPSSHPRGPDQIRTNIPNVPWSSSADDRRRTGDHRDYGRVDDHHIYGNDDRRNYGRGSGAHRDNRRGQGRQDGRPGRRRGGKGDRDRGDDQRNRGRNNPRTEIYSEYGETGDHRDLGRTDNRRDYGRPDDPKGFASPDGHRPGPGGDFGRHGGDYIRTGGDIPRPGGDYARPEGDLTRPGGDFPRPGGDFPRPGGDFPRPGGDFPRPGGDFPRQGGDFPRPGGDFTRPGGDFARPGGDFARPGGDFARPGGDFARPGGDFTRPGGDFTRPGGDFTRLGGDFTRPGGDYPRSGDRRIDRIDGQEERRRIDDRRDFPRPTDHRDFDRTNDHRDLTVTGEQRKFPSVDDLRDHSRNKDQLTYGRIDDNRDRSHSESQHVFGEPAEPRYYGTPVDPKVRSRSESEHIFGTEVTHGGSRDFSRSSDDHIYGTPDERNQFGRPVTQNREFGLIDGGQRDSRRTEDQRSYEKMDDHRDHGHLEYGKTKGYSDSRTLWDPYPQEHGDSSAGFHVAGLTSDIDESEAKQDGDPKTLVGFQKDSSVTTIEPETTSQSKISDKLKTRVKRMGRRVSRRRKRDHRCPNQRRCSVRSRRTKRAATARKVGSIF